MKKTLLFFGLALFSLVACKQAALPQDEVSGRTAQDLPYTDSSELERFSSDANIINFNIARKIAILDMALNGTFDKNGWQNCTLGVMPVTLYGFDDKPLFYDFMVVDNSGYAHGTVTVHARKRSAMQIKQLSHNVVNYNGAATKLGGSKRFYADVYANRYVTGGTKSVGGGRAITNIATGVAQYDAQFLEDEQMLAALRNDILPEILGDAALANQVADTLQSQMIVEHEATRQFWLNYDPATDDIGALDDRMLRSSNIGHMDHFDTTLYPPLIDGPVIDPGSGYNPPTGGYWETDPKGLNVVTNPDGKLAWLREYQNRFGSYDTGGYCGPWVVGYILSANYNTTIDYNQFDREGYTYQGGNDLRGMMFAPQMNNALRDYSHNKGDAITVDLRGMGQWKAYWRIREGNSAVRVLIWWHGFGKDKDGKYDGTTWHWTHMYGSYRVKRTFSTSYYFLQADNNTTVEENYRGDRDPYNASSYTELQWFDTIFGINDRKLR